MRLTGRVLPPWGRVWIVLSIVALFGNVLPFYLVTLGQETIDSGMAGILMAVMPLIVILLAHFVLPDEPLGLPKVIGFGLGFVGIVVLMAPQITAPTMDESILSGQLAVFGGACCYSVTVIAVRLYPPDDPISASVGAVSLAAILSLPIALIADAPPDSFHWDSIAAVLMLAVFPSGIASVLYFALIARSGPSFLALSNYLVPAFAVLLGALFLNEQVGSGSLIALGLILIGIVLAQKAPRLAKSTNNS